MFCTMLLIGTMWAQSPEQKSSANEDLLWQKLSDRITRMADDTAGVVGVSIVDLTTGRELAINADRALATASCIKVAVLAELYRQSQQGGPGKAKLTDTYLVNQADLVADSYIMGGLTPGTTRLTNRDLATMMIAVSDNSATNVLIDHVGMANVNAMLDSFGFSRMRLQRKMMDIEAAKQGRENISTPREFTRFFQALYTGKVLSKPMTDDFFKLLSTPKDSWIPRLLPADLQIANKPGSLDGLRNDVGIIFVKNRPFAIAIMTGYLRDGAEGERAISRIAKAAYDHFSALGENSEYGRH
jgi:beta-lactamase class A